MRLGICIPISERAPEPRALSYREMRELAVTTEQSGLDSIWVADHLFIRGQDGVQRGAWESLSMLGALADATSRVELGPLVLCTPFRNPGLIAWAANTLDEISGGRFVLGLGAGWHEPEFAAFGYEFERRVSMFDDALAIVVPLLREGVVAHRGELATGDAVLRPAGPRRGGPPILIAGVRPRMMRLVARWADRWNSVWWGLPNDEFRAERQGLVDACLTVGRDPATIEVSVGVVVRDPDTVDGNDAKLIAGTTDHIASALMAWRDEGVSEVMCRLEPPAAGVVEIIARAWQGVPVG
jgi:alkanesulfonate monooxygenase SsuD/methylene tetrahydromethanopterin reductase-like flavin-dependent oxidoreductase (luciferase family)